MKRTLIFLIAMVAMVSAKATVVTTEQSFTETWGFTVTGSDNVKIDFNQQWANYKLTQESFSVKDYPSFKIYFKDVTGTIKMKISNFTLGDGGQYVTLDGNSGDEIAFDTEKFASDKNVSIFLIQNETEGAASIRIEKVVLLDGEKNETILYNGIKDSWGYDALNYFGANIQFTDRYGNVKLPVAALGEDGEVVTYTVKFRNPITKPVGFNYKYNGAEDFQYDWPQTNAGATEAVFTFKNTSAKYLTNLEMVEKSTGTFAAWSVEIESIEKTTTTFADMEPKVLYAGEQTISKWGDCVTLDATSVAMTSDNNLYILVSDYSGESCDLRISNADNWDLAYPSVGYNFLQDVDANGIVKVSMTKAFFDGVSDGDKKQIAVWGNGGFKIKAIATTWETLLCPVTTDELGYATYGNFYTLALDLLPEGLKAFTANLDGAKLSFVEKTEAVGPGTGLLIQGERNTTYYLPAKTDGTDPAYNDLSANMEANTLAGLWKADTENYVFLMKKNTTGTGNIEFKRLTNAELVVPANKAYVQVSPSVFPKQARELIISFGEGEVTGISEATLLNINEVIKNNNVYDLSGRRVAKPTKGLYIVNGKKVVIK